MMARPTTPVGMWGKVTCKPDGEQWHAYAYYRDYDGVSRRVNRWGATQGAAKRALNDALQNRQHGACAEITAETRL